MHKCSTPGCNRDAWYLGDNAKYYCHSMGYRDSCVPLDMILKGQGTWLVPMGKAS